MGTRSPGVGGGAIGKGAWSGAALRPMAVPDWGRGRGQGSVGGAKGAGSGEGLKGEGSKGWGQRSEVKGWGQEVEIKGRGQRARGQREGPIGGVPLGVPIGVLWGCPPLTPLCSGRRDRLHRLLPEIGPETGAGGGHHLH